MLSAPRASALLSGGRRSTAAEARGDGGEGDRHFRGHGPALDLDSGGREPPQRLDFRRVEMDRRRHLLAPGREVDVAEVEMPERDPSLVQGDRIAHVADEKQGASRRRSRPSGTKHRCDIGDGRHPERHLARHREPHRRPRERVPGDLVIGDQDGLHGECRHPRLQHLSVDEPGVDPDERDPGGTAHCIAFRSCSDAWPIDLRADSASCEAISPMGKEAARSDVALSTMGRFTPVTTSTLRSARKDRQSCVGDPPSRSVSKRTPSPWSTFVIASAIFDRESGCVAETATASTLAIEPTTPSAVRMSSSASFPCEATTSPTIWTNLTRGGGPRRNRYEGLPPTVRRTGGTSTSLFSGAVCVGAFERCTPGAAWR